MVVVTRFFINVVFCADVARFTCQGFSLKREISKAVKYCLPAVWERVKSSCLLWSGLLHTLYIWLL